MRVIHKIAAVVIKDNKFFVVRKKGKDIWTSLGGKPEDNETEEETLIRETKEEINCDLKILRKLLVVEDKAVFDVALVKLSFYLIQLIGDPKIIDNELEEWLYIDSNYKLKNVKLSPSLENKVIPFCIKDGLLIW